MDWEDVVEEARESLGFSKYGWVGTDAWEEIVECAKKILREEASKIATWEHKDYLSSQEWKDKRLIRLKIDNYLCQDCLKIIPKIFEFFNNLEYEPSIYEVKAEDVHHLDYHYKQTASEIEYCISLCKLHHELRHCFNKDGIKWLNKKIEDNIIYVIYNRILNQDSFLKLSQQQHDNFKNSITIKPNDWLNKELNKEEEDGRNNS